MDERRGAARASFRARGRLAGGDPVRPAGRGARDRAQPVRRRAGARSIRSLEWVSRLPGGAAGDLIADLLLQQERVCETLGLRARQQQIIDSLIAHLAREGGSARLAEVYLRQGDLSTLLKRFDAADRALATALRIGQRARRHDAGPQRACAASDFCGGTKDGTPKRSTSRGARSPWIASATTTWRSPST